MIAITHHAAERYQDRVDPSMSLNRARAYLEEVAQDAPRLKERTKYGELQYHLPDCILIVKEVSGRGDGLLGVSVYPLPTPIGVPSRELEMALERVTSRARAELDQANIPEVRVKDASPRSPLPKRLGEPDPRIDRYLAEMDHLFDRFRIARESMDKMRQATDIAAKQRNQNRHASYQRVVTELCDLKAVLRKMARYLPNTPEVQEELGAFAAIIFPETEPPPPER